VSFAGPTKAAALSRRDLIGVPGNAALGRAATFGEYRTFESDFLNGLDAGLIMLLGSQQPFPAMRQAQPKLSIAFAMRVRGEFSTLPDLILEEIGRFEHRDHHDKSPARRGFDEAKTQEHGICSERSTEQAVHQNGLADLGIQDLLELTDDCRAENIQSMWESPRGVSFYP
jgi:hypothetical protein